MNNAIEHFLNLSPVVPVVTIEHAVNATPLAEALLAGGIRVIEVTLRTTSALAAIEQIARNVPGMLVAVGTVLTAEQLQSAQQAGAKIAISPGLNESLVAAADRLAIPLLPGIATASELMRGLEAGLSHFKLFPAAAIGGVELAKALAGPFPQARFCPTGGISFEAASAYLALPNVTCIGASWVASAADIDAQRWEIIRTNAVRAAGLMRGI